MNIHVFANLEAVLRTGSLAGAAAAVAGPITLGVIETMQMGLLPGAFRHLRERHPALRVRPVRGRSVELVEAVKAGRLDAAVVVQPHTGGSQRLNWIPLVSNQLVLVAPPDSTDNSLAALSAATIGSA